MIHIFMLIIGCCVGSFVNVILSRKDWYSGRSKCDHCGNQIKWYDLIPVVSYICLGGKCRKCKEKIDKSHIVSEVLMGGAFLCSSFVLSQKGIWYGLICFVVLFFIALAAIEDYKEQMVYSWILNAGIVISCAVKMGIDLMFADWQSVIILLGSVLLLKILAMILAKGLKDRIGAGDFDILIIMYILCGLYGTALSVMVACVIGCIIYLPQIAAKKRSKDQPLPLVPLLLAGTICNVLLL